MKKLLLTSALICFFVIGYSQGDTLYTKAQKKIPCKIVEIGESDIKYKILENLDGPMYSINVSKVFKYTLANGYTEILKPDELLIENQHAEIMNNKSVIKVQPFSFVNNQISVAYEQVIKFGMNLDVELGYINNSISPSTANNNQFYTANMAPAFCSGAYIKPGVKFMLGQDFSLKGMKYAHPLKGRYIKLDLAFSFMNFQDIYDYDYSYSGYYPQPQTYTTTSQDLNTFGYGAFVNYGRQFILGNIISLEYYIGVGVSGQSFSYNNTKVVETGTSYNYYGYYGSSEAKYISNYHAFFRMPDVGISGTLGFRLGYIIPEKKTRLHQGDIKE